MSTQNPSQAIQNFLIAVLIALMGLGCALALVVTRRLSVTPSQVQEEVLALREQVSHIEDLRTEATMLVSVLENSDLAIVGLDSVGRITVWSRGADQLFGMTKDDVIGYSVAVLIPTSARDAHRLAFEAAMTAPRRRPFQQIVECDARHRSGELIPVQMHLWGVPGQSAMAVFSRQNGVDNLSKRK